MATQIGVVKALIGEVTATAADGTIRKLQIGDTVYANELISTGTGGAVEIEFADGSVMDLGRESQAMLDMNVFDLDSTTFADGGSDNVTDDIAAIQQAILEGEDPTKAGEATAAGAGTEGGNEGHEAEFVDYLNPEVTPDAGFDTVGVNSPTDDYVDEQQIILLQQSEQSNQSPQAMNAIGSGFEDSDGIEVILSATDADGTIEYFIINELHGNGTWFVGDTEVNEGMLVPASDGSATVWFVPNPDWSDNNGNPTVTLDYIAVDNEGAQSDPATATINVVPVTDTPTVTISLEANNVKELYAADLSNVLTNADGLVGNPAGFSVTALKLDGDAWVETNISVKDSGTPTGFGVAGNGGSNGADVELESGEKLFIELDSPAASVTFQLAWLNSSNETAVYTLTYDDGTTETFQITGGSDRVDPPVTMDAPDGKTITAIEFSTPTTGNRVTTSDYLVHSVSYSAAFMTYSVDIAAMPTDTDGSESITQLLVKTPEGVILSDSKLVETVDGESTWLLLLDELDNDVNDYTGPTVNVSANGEVTVSGLTLTVPTGFDGQLTISAEATAHDPGADTSSSQVTQITAITGDSSSNELVGTEGNDLLTGGAGHDILTGGDGADIFVWNAGDEGSYRPAVDTITDFNAAEGDSLDLADILQGEESGDITDYISVTQSGSDVVIKVTPDGDGGVMNQIITLENTTLNDIAGTDTAASMSQADIINTLIANGQLNVDQS